MSISKKSRLRLIPHVKTLHSPNLILYKIKSHQWIDFYSWYIEFLFASGLIFDYNHLIWCTPHCQPFTLIPLAHIIHRGFFKHTCTNPSIHHVTKYIQVNFMWSAVPINPSYLWRFHQIFPHFVQTIISFSFHII